MSRLLLMLAPSLLGIVAVLGGPAAAVGYRDGAFIAEDTTWQGGIEITGPLYVKKGATLTILPGTVVRFLPSDEDGDGIGDGELKVEGRLVAVGTPERMITFTSGAEEPKMKDWTYVMIELSRDSRVEHALFEYAFTGLQVHFSTAVVENCVFRRNFEALRFSTADMSLAHNDIVENVFGIRYESRGSRTVITRNDVVDNDYAFFPVVKSGSEVRIFENNIKSRDYNVKLGARQREDLDFTRNWWGTTDGAVIEEGIFDRRRDDTLGRVDYEPFLASPVMDSGRRPQGNEE